MNAQLEDSDITEATAEYLWAVCGEGKLAPISVVRRRDFDDADNVALVSGVRDRLAAFRQGARLTVHRTGDGYEAYREPYKDLLRNILDEWQRGEIPGGTARLMTGSVSYGQLYGLARDLHVQIRFFPRVVAQRIASGDLTRDEGRRMLGIEDSDIGAFVEAWTL